MAFDISSERMNDEMARLGKAMVTRLFVLFKTSQNYSEGHAALDAPLVALLKVLHAVQAKNEEASLRVKGLYLYLGDLRLKPDSAALTSFGFLREELTRHGIGGVCFEPSASIHDLRRFIYTFQEIEGQPGPDSYTTILERMQQRMIGGIDLESLPEEVEKVPVDRENFQPDRLKARLLYQQSADAMDRELENAQAGKPLRLRGPKRVVQQIIDLLAREEASLLGLCTPRNQESRGRHHATNVCILSLALGRRLGMSKSALCELGLAALFHDIGLAGMPLKIRDESVELSPSERLVLETHPLAGVEKIMQLKVLDTLSARIITGVFEHHLLADFSGYPRFPYKRLGLFGRVISIADGYDTLTSQRLRGAAPYSPEKAVRYLFTQAGKEYDQALLKIFIGCVGLHAVGSLLQLDSKELAVVVENSSAPERWCLPKVKIIADPGGNEVDGELVDLAHPASLRSIAGTLDPHLYKLDVSRYLL
jgi:HD-GYP domain-containing protein (c-di-GMP phosphodiesterase class II)